MGDELRGENLVHLNVRFSTETELKKIQDLKQATVRQVRPHALRHTFATTCLQAGCDVKTLSELLGHANANITLQRYVHSDLTRKRREMNRIFSHQVSMRGRKTSNVT